MGRDSGSFDARGFSIERSLWSRLCRIGMFQSRDRRESVPHLLQKRFPRLRQPPLQPHRAIAVLARPRLRSILIPALPPIMRILHARQFEILFPIRPLFLQRRRAITDLNPSGDAVSPGPRIAHVAQIFAPGDRAPSERPIVDSAKQSGFPARPNARSHQITQCAFILRWKPKP
jgi:hypothetical protein